MTLFQQKKKSIQIIALFPNITLKKLHSLTILRLMQNQRFQKLFLFIFNYFQNFSSSITQFVIRPAIRSFIGKIGNVSQERFDSCASSKFPRIRLYSLREHGFERFGVIEHLPRLEIHFATTWGPCDRKRACTCGKTRRSEARLKVFRKNSETYQKYVQPYCVSWKRCDSCCSCTVNFDTKRWSSIIKGWLGNVRASTIVRSN